MKVYCVIQAYHHANWAIGCLESILGFFYGFQFRLLFGRLAILLLWEGPIVANVVFARETMNPRDRADEPAVGHVSEGGEVGLLASGRGNGTAALNPSS